MLYEQKDSIVARSVLASIVASYFMEDSEHQALNMAPKIHLASDKLNGENRWITGNLFEYCTLQQPDVILAQGL
jgi:hypothetical protein